MCFGLFSLGRNANLIESSPNLKFFRVCVSASVLAETHFFQRLVLQISFLLSTLRHFQNGAKVFKKPFNSKIPLDASMALVVEWQKSLPQLRTTSTVTEMSFWRVKRAVGSQSP
jgi:hypothetical protein